MEKVQTWLKNFGLNNTEISVYVYILKNGSCKTADIQRGTSLVRTTIYYTLANLKKEGLISENSQNNVRTYRAADLSNLEGNIEEKIHSSEEKLAELQMLKPFFKQMQTDAPQESFVARFEGVTAVKQAIEQAFRCDSKRWHIIASRDNFLYHMSKQYKKYYLDERKRRGIVAKTLWEPTDSFSKPNLEDVFYRNPRKLPEAFRGSFSSLVILYDDTTLIVDSYQQKTAHAVHNPTSTTLMRLMHEALWNSSSKL